MKAIRFSPELHLEVLDAVHRYATGIDTRDWDLFRSAFHEDAEVDFGFQQWSGAESFTAFMRETHDPLGRTQHRMTNTVPTGIDPIAARTYGEGFLLQADDESGTTSRGWYDDEFIRTEEHGLQIVRRRVDVIAITATGPNLLKQQLAAR